MHIFPFSHEHTLTEQDFVHCCRDCERSYTLVSEGLRNFHARINSYSREELRRLSQQEIYQLYLILDDIAHLECGHNLADRILISRDIQDMLPDIRWYYTTFFEVHETCLVQEVLAADDPWQPLQVFGLYPRYETLIRTQMEQLALPRPKKLAFVGCGPLPLSLILLNRLYGIHSVGLDIDPKAVILAGQCLERLGLDQGISVIQGTEETLAELEWDVVVVAALAEPKQKIFSSLRRIMTCVGKRPVICRTYSGLKTLLHPPLREEDYTGFTVHHEIRPKTGRVNNTLVQLEMTE
ncbi:MAG: nicotianamine synthase [Candidatus Electrothrix sp. EH2]|nr:nicotianamine synthase [Candidatus Electrothrix sp. EH2]